jgi:hypothetical protein
VSAGAHSVFLNHPSRTIKCNVKCKKFNTEINVEKLSEIHTRSPRDPHEITTRCAKNRCNVKCKKFNTETHVKIMRDARDHHEMRENPF